jgi:plastocyanin
VRRDPLIAGPARAAVLACLVASACVAGPVSSPVQPTGTSSPVTVTIATAGGGLHRFVPAMVTVPSGSEIRLVFRNESSESHNLSFTGSLEPIRTQTIMEPGKEEVLTFTPPGPGAYPFVCTVHVGMAGELRVSPSVGRS